MLKLRVSERTFEIPRLVVKGSLLSKCMASPDLVPLAMDAEGFIIIQRDARLFESVILPFLHHGYFDPTHIDPFEALQELDYYGLSASSLKEEPGFSLHQAQIACRIVVDRVVNTMAEQPMINLLFFAEKVRFDPFETSFDVSLFSDMFAPLFLSRALTDYRLHLRYVMFEAEVHYCQATKCFRVTETCETVHAYVMFHPVNQGTLHTSGFFHEVPAYELVTNTPSRYLLDCREASFRDEGDLRMNGRARVFYDQLQKCQVVDLSVTAGVWDATGSYSLWVVAVPVALKDEWHPPETAEGVIEATEADARFRPIMRQGIRLSCTSTGHGVKNKRFPASQYVLWFGLYCCLVTSESFVAADPSRRAIRGSSRVVTQNRTRRLCRLHVVALKT